jgi:hypothetical protein
MAMVRFIAGARDFSQIFRAHPASYPLGTRNSFLWGKVAGGMKLTTHLHLVLRSRMVQLYLHSSNMALWCSIIEHKDNFTFYLVL